MDPNYRSSFKSTFEFFKVNNLNENMKYRGALKMTPFWKIFKAFMKGKANSRFLTSRSTAASEIIKTYQTNTFTFKIGPYTDMVFSDIDVKKIFGIRCRDQEMIHLSYAKKPDSKFVRRYFKEKKNLTQLVIKEALVQAVERNRAKDVARLLCLLLCVDLFFGTTGTRLGWKFVKYAQSLKKIKEYAWHKAIHSTLMESVRVNYRTPYKVKGCVIALQFWLCEHTKICSPANMYGSPWFLKWNLFDLEKGLRTLKLDELREKYVLRSELPMEAKGDVEEHDDLKETISSFKNKVKKVRRKTRPLFQNEERDRKGYVLEFLTQEERDILDSIQVFDKEETIVWMGESPFSSVSLRDMNEIINNKNITSNVIDSFAEILNRRQMQKNLSGNDGSYFFFSTFKKLLESKNQKSAQILVDKAFENCSGWKYIHFPLNHHNNHWTLLVLNTEDMEWSHYNSLRPSNEREDPCLKLASNVIDEFIRLMPCEEKGKLISAACPQQSSGSLDCGVVVCYAMKQIDNGELVELDVPDDKWTRFRAEIISAFLNDPPRTRKQGYTSPLVDHGNTFPSADHGHTSPSVHQGHTIPSANHGHTSPSADHGKKRKMTRIVKTPVFPGMVSSYDASCMHNARR